MVDQFTSVYDRDLLFIISNNVNSNCEVSGTNIWKFDQEELILLYKLESHRMLHESFQPGTFYGLVNDELVEYKLETLVDTIIKKYRKWKIEANDEVAFIPRGIGIGLGLYNGETLIKLHHNDYEVKNDKYGYESNECIIGKTSTIVNNVLPIPTYGSIAVINVGEKGKQRTLIATAVHEETSVEVTIDFIKIYEDVTNGKIFHKIPAYKPSSLASLEFGNNGETLLLFMEDEKVLQVYEYKGIGGFQQRTSITLNGSTLTHIKIPMINGHESINVIGAIHNNEINFLHSEVDGNRFAGDKIDCDL